MYIQDCNQRKSWMSMLSLINPKGLTDFPRPKKMTHIKVYTSSFKDRLCIYIAFGLMHLLMDQTY